MVNNNREQKICRKHLMIVMLAASSIHIYKNGTYDFSDLYFEIWAHTFQLRKNDSTE